MIWQIHSDPDVWIAYRKVAILQVSLLDVQKKLCLSFIDYDVVKQMQIKWKTF